MKQVSWANSIPDQWKQKYEKDKIDHQWYEIQYLVRGASAATTTLASPMNRLLFHTLVFDRRLWFSPTSCEVKRAWRLNSSFIHVSWNCKTRTQIQESILLKPSEPIINFAQPKKYIDKFLKWMDGNYNISIDHFF